jgi:hypothetical protein
MSLVPIYMIPGVCKSTTTYASGKVAGYMNGRVAQGRVTSADKVRWVAGFPEKIGGWVEISVGPLEGIPRASKQWRSVQGTSYLCEGTETHLYAFNGNTSTLTDITPLRVIATGTLTNAITTTNGSTLVSVTDSSNALAVGDWVYLSAGSAVGGLTINGWYQVVQAGSPTYQIVVATAATSGATGGGTIATQYPRVTLTNPFTTTNASPTVTVHHVAHGAQTGEYVTFSGASAVGGLTLNGEYQLTVLDLNNYTITASSNATSGATGGGFVSVIYDIYVPTTAANSGISGWGAGAWGAGPWGIGTNSSASGVGYGTGAYGIGAYQMSAFVQPFSVSGWTLAPYGGLMLAAPIGGTIYIYDPVAGGRAYPLLNAPATVQAILVTPERFVVALGINGNLLEISWPDQSDFTNWTTLPTNTANSGRTLQGGSYFVGGTPDVNGASLILTNRCCFEMLYTGDNEVYSTPVMADNSGLISPWAIVAMGGMVYWMSDTDFWMWNGSVQAMPSDDIRDYVFQNLNTTYAGKCFAGLCRAKKEVWFFYVSNASTEIDSYVIWSTAQNCWSTGTLVRTTWVDSELFPFPVAADNNGYLYQHEVGTDSNGSAMDATLFFAPTDISNGSFNMDMFGFIPDFERQTGNVSLNILTQFYPEDTPSVDGPYTLAANDSTPRIDLRSNGKMIGFELESNVIGGDFRVALLRVDAQQAGARR